MFATPLMTASALGPLAIGVPGLATGLPEPDGEGFGAVLQRAVADGVPLPTAAPLTPVMGQAPVLPPWPEMTAAVVEEPWLVPPAPASGAPDEEPAGNIMELVVAEEPAGELVMPGPLPPVLPPAAPTPPLAAKLEPASWSHLNAVVVGHAGPIDLTDASTRMMRPDASVTPLPQGLASVPTPPVPSRAIPIEMPPVSMAPLVTPARFPPPPALAPHETDALASTGIAPLGPPAGGGPSARTTADLPPVTAALQPPAMAQPDAPELVTAQPIPVEAVMRTAPRLMAGMTIALPLAPEPAATPEAAAFGPPTAPATAIPSASEPARIAPPSPVRQVLPLTIAMLIAPGAAPTLTVTLEPGEMGRLEIRVGRDAEGTTLRLIAERPDTAAILQRDGRELQQGLAQSGIRLDAGAISFETAGGGGQPRERPPPRDRPSRGPPAGTEPEAPLSLLDLRI